MESPRTPPLQSSQVEESRGGLGGNGTVANTTRTVTDCTTYYSNVLAKYLARGVQIGRRHWAAVSRFSEQQGVSFKQPNPGLRIITLACIWDHLSKSFAHGREHMEQLAFL